MLISEIPLAPSPPCPHNNSPGIARSESKPRQNVTCSCVVAVGCRSGVECVVNQSIFRTNSDNSTYACIRDPSTNASMAAAGFARAVSAGSAGTYGLAVATATEELPLLDAQTHQAVHVFGVRVDGRRRRRRRRLASGAASALTAVYNGRVAVHGARVRLRYLRIQGRRQFGGTGQASEPSSRVREWDSQHARNVSSNCNCSGRGPEQQALQAQSRRYCKDCVPVTIAWVSCSESFLNPSTGNGGAIQVYGNGQLLIEHVQLHDNYGAKFGGAIAAVRACVAHPSSWKQNAAQDAFATPPTC